MQTIEQLTNPEQSVWAVLQDWIKQARNHCEILSKDKKRAEQDLFSLQIPTSSPMGAVVYETGGILVHQGWLRILGSGSFKLERSLLEWNFGKSFANSGEKPRYLLVADDVIGGYFALNGGFLGDNLGKIYYFSPHDLKWHDLNFSYTEFLLWALNGDLEAFYQGYFWHNWQADVKLLDSNQVFSFQPELHQNPQLALAERRRLEVDIERHFTLSTNEQDKFASAYEVK